MIGISLSEMKIENNWNYLPLPLNNKEAHPWSFKGYTMRDKEMEQQDHRPKFPNLFQKLKDSAGLFN